MPFVKVIRHGQVTLPSDFREELGIKEGDYLQAELEGKAIVLRPKVFMDRDGAVRAFRGMMSEAHERTRDLDPEEIDEIIEQTIKEVRQERIEKQKLPVTESKVR